MGVFDRLQTYSANVGIEPAEKPAEDIVAQKFDVTKPAGYFLRVLHNMGYKVVDEFYFLDDKELTQNEYEALSDEDKARCIKRIDTTEFANMLNTDGDVLALSSAGSGKTTALTFKIMKDIITGEATKPMQIPDGATVNVVDSIFVGTFLKSGADELKKNLEYWQRRLGYMVTADRINFGTLHAEFKRALNAMGVATPIAKPEDLRKYLKKAVDRLGISRDDGSKLTFDDYNVIEGILAYYRNRLDMERYKHPACDDYGLSKSILDALYLRYQEYKTEAKVMDFEDLQELLYQYLYVTPNPAVQEFIANRYSYIYLDEFQDTSQIQFAILKFYARGRLECNKKKGYGNWLKENNPEEYFEGLETGVETHGKIVCIGDDDQAIYSWRGSDVSIITHKYIANFQPNVVKLSTNYRCPANVLQAVVPSITKNLSRYPKTLRAAKQGGTFGAYEFASLPDMSMFMLQQIADDMSKNKSVAIICRTNFDGMIPALMLERQNKFAFSISSDAMSLNSPMARAMLEVASLFTERSTPAVKKTLTLLVPYWSRFQVDSLINTLRNDDNVRKRSSIWNLSEDDINYSCPELFPVIKKMKGYMFEPKTGKKIEGGEIVALQYLYGRLATKVYYKDNPYCTKMRAYIYSLIQILEVGDFLTVHDFLNEMSDLGDRLQARIKKDKTPISIVTVHEFKGKERDVTYVWNDSDGVFPTRKTNLENQREVEEERRVHYIACTRAKEKNIVMTLKDKHGIFFDELGGTVMDASKVAGVLSKNIKVSNSISSPEGVSVDEREKAELINKLAAAQFDDVIPSL